MVNLDHLGQRQHDVIIPVGLEDEEAAPFFRYDFDIGSPELLTTRGRNCHVYARFLHARPRPYPCKALTKRQRLLFHPQERHTPLVDRALDLERDVTLRAEVQHFRHNIKTGREISLRLAMLKEEYNNTRAMTHQSARRLAAADAATRIMGRVIEEVAEEDHLPRRILEPGMRSLDHNTEPLRYEEKCGWCRKPSHDATACSMLRQCLLCQGWGHREEDCRNPHRYCVEQEVCQVPTDQAYYLRTQLLCRSTIRTVPQV
jgi:hypothetical protein